MAKKLHMYCDGHCGWIYRQCAGVSDPFFKICMLKTQSDEIASLRSMKRKIDCSASWDSNFDRDGSCIPNDLSDTASSNLTSQNEEGITLVSYINVIKHKTIPTNTHQSNSD